MKLGIVYKDGKVINHRSLIKVILNPILRYFGYQIGTLFDDGILGKPVLVSCERIHTIEWPDYGTDFDYILKQRLWV